MITETIDHFLSVFPNLPPQLISDVVKQHPTLDKKALEEDLVDLGGVHALEVMETEDDQMDDKLFDEMQLFLMDCNEHQATVIGYVHRGEPFNKSLLSIIEGDITAAEKYLATKLDRIQELPLIEDGLRITIREGKTLLLSWEALIEATRELTVQEEKRRDPMAEPDPEPSLIRMMSVRSIGRGMLGRQGILNMIPRHR